MKDRFKFRILDEVKKTYCNLMTRDDVKFLITSNGQLCRVIIYEDGHTILTYPKDKYKLEFCTGLKDCNGKLIYEGDILEYTKNPRLILKTFISNVIFNNEKACFGFYKNKLFYSFSEFDEVEHDLLKNIKIIGNIHQNPELVEGEGVNDI